MVECPVCSKPVKEAFINEHIDSGCKTHLVEQNDTPSTQKTHSFFATPAGRRTASSSLKNGTPSTSTQAPPSSTARPIKREASPLAGIKRPFGETNDGTPKDEPRSPGLPKRSKVTALQKVAPLAERMRPTSLDDVCGQKIVAPNGLLRGMIESGRMPSIILWGGPGTGKTTIARLIANTSGSRFVEINSSTTGVAEVKKLFTEALNELQLTGRRTIIFCDEIHRFSKAQQDVFLGPVEAGQITLIAATTENPSFKVINALLSRCRTLTLQKLTEDDIVTILERAMATEKCESPLLDTAMLRYFASFADGDARIALNLLELAIGLVTKKPDTTVEEIKQELTRTLVYDRAGDQHYDTISALHKSIRGSNADAALYYLARMLVSGEDPLYIARRLIVLASEDIGLADNSMLTLATSTHTACEKIGMPECRINLAHCVVAFCHAPKSTRAYRGLGHAMKALEEPGVAGLPIPLHLRNAPTRLMKELGYGKEYKYNPEYLDGHVKQDYLPEKLKGRTFLEDFDLGTKIDPELDILDDAPDGPIANTGEEGIGEDDVLLPEMED